MVTSLAILAATEALAQLSRRSPFDSQDKPVLAASALPLEFAGFIRTRDGLQFRVQNPARKAAAFVQLGVRDAELDVTVRHYDSENSALIVEHQGRTLTLPERKPKVRSAGAAQSLVPNGPPRAVTPATARPVTSPANLSVYDDRLNAIRAELEKREKARAKAAGAVR